MSTRALIRSNDLLPSFLDDFLKPWNEWGNGGLWGKTITMPPVNITENKEEYMLTMAAPGMKKNDFTVDVEANMLTISCDKEESKEEKDSKHTRKEYNYSSFSRSFTLPEEVRKDKIEANYIDGVLQVSLPKKEEAKNATLSKHIQIK